MHTSNTQPPKRDNKRDFITTAVQSAMAAEATAQVIMRAKLVDSPPSQCSTLRVNDLVYE